MVFLGAKLFLFFEFLSIVVFKSAAAKC